MDSANFCNGFYFNIFRFDRYHFTDLSKKPVPHHYIGCLIKGSATIRSQQQELKLRPNEIFYIPKGLNYQSHWFGDSDGVIEFYSFGFDVAPTRSAYRLQKIDCSPQEQLLFDQLCEEIPFTEKGIGKLYRFFTEVAQGMEKDQIAHPVIEKATAFIYAHPKEKIPKVAAHCNMSEAGLYALFKRQLDKTPNEVRLEALCEKAVTLLSTTNQSVQEISDTVGFSSTSYFRKVLRNHTGKTPLSIRKESVF